MIVMERTVCIRHQRNRMKTTGSWRLTGHECEREKARRTTLGSDHKLEMGKEE